MSDEVDDKDSESKFEDDLLWWYVIEDSEGGRASPLWIGVCVLVVIAVAVIVAMCS